MTRAVRTALLVEAGQASLDWWLDTRDCHFCQVSGERSLHDDECPLEFTNEWSDRKRARERSGTR